MAAVRKDYAAQTGLEFNFGFGSTKMPRLRRCALLALSEVSAGCDRAGFGLLTLLCVTPRLCVKIPFGKARIQA